MLKLEMLNEGQTNDIGRLHPAQMWRCIQATRMSIKMWDYPQFIRVKSKPLPRLQKFTCSMSILLKFCLKKLDQ